MKTMFKLLLFFLLVFLTAIAISTAVCFGDPLPRQVGPLGITPSPLQIELGRRLFFDRNLSVDGTVSCADCHNPRQGWSDGRSVAVGVRGLVGTMNSPTIINASYIPLVFWNGRTITEVPQALLPLVNPVEMGNRSEQEVINRLQIRPDMIASFAKAFDPVTYDRQTRNPITAANLAYAIAAFEHTIISANAPVDQYREGKAAALSMDAQLGYKIFQTKGCMRCHTPPLFTDNLFHNNGMEFAAHGRLSNNNQIIFNDSGRFSQTNRESDRRAFKTPTLREIVRTGPYGHAGSFATIRQVLDHYNRGGVVTMIDPRTRRPREIRDQSMDVRIQPLGLNEMELQYLETFLVEGMQSPTYPLY